MKHPRLFAALVLTASLGIHLYADLAVSSIVTAAAGIATWLGTPSSANLAAALTDETGSGKAVFDTTPTFTTPVLGAATGTSVALSSFHRTTSAMSRVAELNALDSGNFSYVGTTSNHNFNVVSNNTIGMTLTNTGAVSFPLMTAGSAGDEDVCMTPGSNTLTDANASTCIVSSLRYKSNWHALDVGLGEVLKLTPGAFYYTNDPKKVERIGLNAENMASVEPRLAFYEQSGPDIGKPRGVAYEETVALLVKAIQELTARLTVLEQQRP